ncbi:MAG: LuxR C-terminal-related transcriptional regulator [Bacteroidaceae bacterium]|jgi:regulator of cell morphogenesis and NO signaling|nr:helix-turn-helix transcriptional regulator [Bacteroidaceae bacterium]MBQ2300033.1 helix-turn-helix transcriptional regulator [Bacteroidaceae bacterium]MEE1310272.1 LuxR C-terminal-related transcriptional regulator [Bacteroidaceae bacterium]
MRKMKLYEADDKMIDLISDNYSMLQGLSAFGIRLGFGDKTVCEVCREQDVDCYTFLMVVNFLINGYTPKESDEKISVKTLLGYLQASHRYFIDFQLPSIRTKLEESLQKGDGLATLILRLYDEYAHDIRLHMKYEEKTLFPYVEALLRGEQTSGYNVDIFSKHHSDTKGKFQELKNIIIKYLPHNGLANNQLTATLYDIYNNEEWLLNHSNVEEILFVPAIRLLEQKVKEDDVSTRLSNMIKNAESTESVSEREKEIIICLVQGLSNKEIAAQLFISVNTVITHRRNISRKLQIRSLAGLTIYAIANNLIDSKCLTR